MGLQNAGETPALPGFGVRHPCAAFPMTVPSSPTPATPGSHGKSTAAISSTDFSCRLPLLVLFSSAAKWLVIGWVFELIASIKFHAPGFLADYSWLTYGRVHPAFTNSIIYGFCLQAGLGVILWLITRLGDVPLAQRGLVTLGAAVWNLGVTIGVIGILLGDSTGFEHLEMPGYAVVFVFIGYLLIALWGVVTLHQRRERRLFVSHWFLFTALLWFPWIYSTANLLLVTFPVRGVAQAVIAWWYSQNLLVVWLSLVGVGAAFCFLPKLYRRELSSHYLAIFVYWMLILVAGWGGIPGSAPVPAWMPVLSTIASVFFLLAVVAVALNVCETVGCSMSAFRQGPICSFVLFGVLAFVVAGVMRAASAQLETSQSLNLTWFAPASTLLNYYGFFGMIMFAAVYVIMPRLLGVDLPWPKLLRAHLWLSVAGILLVVLPLALAGIFEVISLSDTRTPFLSVMHSTLTFLRVSTMGDLLLLIGHLLFLANIGGLVVGFYRARATATYAELTADLFKTAGAKS
jgi:cytochrome c oxidase cbb3-type subunit 1